MIPAAEERRRAWRFPAIVANDWEAVVSSGLSRNAAAKRFEVGIASAVHWVNQFEATGEMSPKP